MSEIPETPSTKRDGSKPRRYILISIALLGLSLAATQIFLRITSVGSFRFIPMTFLVWTGTFLIVLALLILMTVLGRNLIKLYFERKSGKLGSGFTTKLVRTFIGLSLLPALLLFVLAYTLINNSIEKWFRAPNDQMMEHSRVLAEQYDAEAGERATYYAARIAGCFTTAKDISRPINGQLKSSIQELSHEYHLIHVRIYDAHSNSVESIGSSISTDLHEKSIKRLITTALSGHQRYLTQRITPTNPIDEIAWASSPIRDEHADIVGAILTEAINPHSAKFRINSVLEAYGKYKELQQEKDTFRVNYLMMLGLATLLLIFAFSWFGLYLAKRITVPIEALAKGAAAIAAGNLDYKVECRASDELESLVASFNRMTGDLQENEKRIAAAQQILQKKSAENAEGRRYIETILQTIATGVISIDDNYRVRTMNRAAIEMLQAKDFSGKAKLEEVIESSPCEAIRALLHKAAVLGTVVKNIELSFPGKTLQLAATATPLADNAGHRTGWVIVLEDVTELLRMEKMSAWQEVARRLAHEIKNPLTPIQLSAQRILNRYKQLTPLPAGNAPDAWQAENTKFEKLLDDCVQVIIAEAGSLKNLVDEFSRFSRLPQIRLEESDLNRVMENALALYMERAAGISIHKDLDPSIPLMRLDPEQMKRVFINLLDNALEAMADNAGDKTLDLQTSCNSQQNTATIEIGDSGRGFPEEYQDSLFLPYFSTRKGGTGLGLAIVRQIVTDHNGSVRAEANHPSGTRIIIELPLRSVDIADLVDKVD